MTLTAIPEGPIAIDASQQQAMRTTGYVSSINGKQGAVHLDLTGGGTETVDGIEPDEFGNVRLLESPGGRAKVWTPKQFGLGKAGKSDTDVLLDMVASGEKHFDLDQNVFNIEAPITFDGPVNLHGRGGLPDYSGNAATKFVCQDASAQIVLPLVGGSAGGFMIDGNSVATGPLLHVGQHSADFAHLAGGAQALLTDVDVRFGLGKGVLFESLQNVLVQGLRSSWNGGVGIDVDNFAGGLLFQLPESTNNSGPNLHVGDGGNIRIYGGFFEREATVAVPSILVDGNLFWGPVILDGVGIASGGTGGDTSSLIKHYGTGVVELRSPNFGATTGETLIELKGRAAHTGAGADSFPQVVVSGAPQVTGNPAHIFDTDDLYLLDRRGGWAGSTGAGGSVPMFTGGSSRIGDARLDQSQQFVTLPTVGEAAVSVYVEGDSAGAPRAQIKSDGSASFAKRVTAKAFQPGVVATTLVADAAVNLNLDAGQVFFIAKAGHHITGLTTSNGVDGQEFLLGIQEGATVTTDTLPGSASSPQWLWAGGDGHKPHTITANNTVWARMMVYSGAYFQIAPQGAIDAPVLSTTAATWTSANPVVPADVFAVETDTHKLKLGDGTTAWTSLAYIAATDSGAARTLAATAVKTTTYTAAVGDIVPCDATSAGFTVTLPTAPADKSRIIVKKVDTSANAVTIARGGSDVFNKTGGSTSLTLSYQFQSVTLQYATSGAIWYVVASDAGAGVIYNNAATFTADVALGAHKITGLANGTAASDAAAFGQIPVRVASTLAAASASNTTSDTTLGTAATIAASALAVGSLIRVDVDGNFDSIATGGIFTLKIKVNGTTVAALSAATSQTGSASALTWLIAGRLYVDATGVGGSVSFHNHRISRSAAGAIVTTPDQAVGVAVDLSGGLTVTVVASMATANAGNVLRLIRGAVVQVS